MSEKNLILIYQFNIMDNLLSPDETLRRESEERMLSVCEDIVFGEKVPYLLEILPVSEDNETTHQISEAIARYFSAFPQEYRRLHMHVKEALANIVSRDLSDTSPHLPPVLNLMQFSINHLQTDKNALQVWVPTLLELGKIEGSLRDMATAPIFSVSQADPDVLREHIPQILDAVDRGNLSLLTPLFNLYTVSPYEFRKRVGTFVSILKSDLGSSSLSLMILQKIAENNPSSLVHHIQKIAMELKVPINAPTILNIFGQIARDHPMAIEPYIDLIAEVSNENSNLINQASNVFELVGSRVQTDKILSILFSFMRTSNDVSPILRAVRGIGERKKGALNPYIEMIQRYENNPQERVREEARLVVDHHEGKDVRSLSRQIEEQNQEISKTVTSIQSLVDYIDENIFILKEFMADVAKRLPTPRIFSTEGVIRKRMVLHFICDREEEGCLYPENAAFIVISKEWHRWLRLAFSALKLGKSILVPQSVNDVGEAIRDIYNSYKDVSEVEFLEFISHPFLTSEEQDKLIHQLMDSGYFEAFRYDAQNADWICSACERLGY